MKIVHSVARTFARDGLGYIAYQRTLEVYKQGFLKKVIAPSFCPSDINKDACMTLPLSENCAKFISRFIPLSLNSNYLIQNRLFDWNVSLVAPDAKIFHGWSSQALLSIRKAKLKKQITFLERPNSHPLLVQKIMAEEYRKYAVKSAFMRQNILDIELKEIDDADFIISPSCFVRQSLMEYKVDTKKILLIPFGVDIEKFKPRPTSGDAKKFRIVFVGQIGLRKGVQYLLKAFCESGLKNSELILAGWIHPDIVELLKQYRNNPGIKIENFTLETPKLYNSASICVFPSIEDGFGLVVLEAMACGKPVIVTENTGAKDVITEGMDGFIVPHCNAEAIKKKIIYLYENKEIVEAMSQAAQRKAQLYTWDKSSQRLIGYYKEALDGKITDTKR